MHSEPTRESRSPRKLGGWIVFLACLLLLSLGASPFHKIADTVLISIRLSLVVVLSILLVRERWSHRHDLPGQRGGPQNSGETILQRCRRLYHGEDR